MQLVYVSGFRFFSALIAEKLPMATDGARSVVCIGTPMSPAKTDEPIEMPFGRKIQVGPRNHALRGGPGSVRGKGQF